MEFEVEEKARDAARSIVQLARQGGEDDVEWLKNNSFVMDGAYEHEAKKYFSALTDEIIDAIDNSIERRLGIK